MSLTENRFAENALSINSTSAEIEEGSVVIGNESLKEFLQSLHKDQPDSEIIFSKRNTVGFTMFQPLFNEVASLSAFSANFKLFNECGNAPTTGKTFTFTKGCLVPVSYTADKVSPAKFAMKLICLWNLGSSISVSAGLGAAVKVLEPYKLKSVTFAGSEIKSLKSVSTNYGYEEAYPDELEPEEVWFTKYAPNGSVVTEDMEEATVERLTGVEKGTLVVTFENVAEATTVYTYTNVSLSAEVNNAQVTLNWNKLTD